MKLHEQVTALKSLVAHLALNLRDDELRMYERLTKGWDKEDLDESTPHGWSVKRYKDGAREGYNKLRGLTAQMERKAEDLGLDLDLIKNEVQIRDQMNADADNWKVHLGDLDPLTIKKYHDEDLEFSVRRVWQDYMKTKVKPEELYTDSYYAFLKDHKWMEEAFLRHAQQARRDAGVYNPQYDG
jgi:hypothetical protein